MVAADRATLECPDCLWVFEAKRPDSRHPAASLEKPQKSKVAGDVTEENHVCRNPKCKKPFTIYWFETLNLFIEYSGLHINSTNEDECNPNRKSLKIMSDILQRCVEPKFQLA